VRKKGLGTLNRNLRCYGGSQHAKRLNNNGSALYRNFEALLRKKF
jgi:hypothetical protein